MIRNKDIIMKKLMSWVGETIWKIRVYIYKKYYKNKSKWIRSWSGKRIDFLDLDPKEITKEDIAVGLSRECRFGNHTQPIYVVAQHCVLASYLVPSHLAFAALLHDASEAYLRDIPSPLKDILPGYRRIEREFEKILFKKYGVPYPIPPEIKEVDIKLRKLESHLFMKDSAESKKPRKDFVEIDIVPWTPDEAKEKFLQRWEELSPV